MNAATVASFNISILPLQENQRLQLFTKFSTFPTADERNLINLKKSKRPTSLFCSNSDAIAIASQSETEDDEIDDNEEEVWKISLPGSPPPVRQRRRRYRKLCPGENKGITEEMRFFAMKLRNSGKPKKRKKGGNSSNSERSQEFENGSSADSGVEKNDGSILDKEVVKENKGRNGNEDIWQPSMEGFLKYLVDSKLVFSNIERIVDESSDVSYVYFRKTGLERSECIARDLEWFRQKGNAIPEPSNPGVTYVLYLKELAETSPPLFLSHFYNIYFSHIAGGQVIAKKVSEKLLEGRELGIYAWAGEEQELLKGVREKLNMLGEHWTRDEKNRCLRETTKAFRYLGQIVRLIIL